MCLVFSKGWYSVRVSLSALLKFLPGNFDEGNDKRPKSERTQMVLDRYSYSMQNREGYRRLVSEKKFTKRWHVKVFSVTVVVKLGERL